MLTREKCIYCGRDGKRICDDCGRGEGFYNMILENGRHASSCDYDSSIIRARPKRVREIAVDMAKRRAGTWVREGDYVYIVCCNVNCRAILKDEWNHITKRPFDEYGYGNCVTCPECAVHHLTVLQGVGQTFKRKRAFA